MTVARRRSWWGWGFEDAALGAGERDALGRRLVAMLGVSPPQAHDPVPLAGLAMPPGRVSPPAALLDLADGDPGERARHARGCSFVDTVRAHGGDLPHLPDAVLKPRDEAGVAAVLEWAAGAGVAVIPFGGGTSVVGGVEPDAGPGYRGVVSLDLEHLDGVVEVDTVSQSACVEAGILGPALEDALRPHDLTLRHFPQSFEFSTLGGWLATRSGGHHASLHTHIDDYTEAIRALTPRGVFESRRLPASGAGPSPDRLLLGSEGTLGVITRAWMRLQPRPRHRHAASVRFARLEAALEAARALAQSGLHPSNCRLLDAVEAVVSGSGSGEHALLLVGFESADAPQEAAMARALALCRDHGGILPEAGTGERDGTVGAWRDAFLRAPYVRDAMVCLGMVAETLETAVTWDRAAALIESVRGAAQAPSVRGVVSCRLTHVYPDGCAPYFTVVAESRRGSQVAQWREVKAAASEAILAGGGTITHHHAVGRDHLPWYARQRPQPFADMLAAAKGAVDPAWILNPGVLLPAPAR